MPKKYKKTKPACNECGWNVDRCSNMDATQREAYPAATRHCTGYRNQAESESEQPACEDCGWNIASQCRRPEASESKNYPNASRECTGPEMKGGYRPAPKPKDPWDVLKVPPEAKVLMVKDDDLYTVFGAESGEVHDLEELPLVAAGPESDLFKEAAATVLSFFVSPMLALAFAARFAEVIRRANDGNIPEEWGIAGEGMLAWLKSTGQHDWHQRTIDKGQDKGTVLPMRCTVCGAVKRPDGVSSSVPRDEGPCLGKTN